jgi:hypothetical protein
MNSNTIMENVIETSQQNVAKVAGFMFLFAFIVPTLNWAFVLSKFIVPGNFIATGNNIMVNDLLFRIGISIELIMSIGLVVLGVTLYIILKSVNKSLALLALSWKLIEAGIVAIITFGSFIVLQTLTGDTFMKVFTVEQLQASAGFLLNKHTALYSIPMVFLGLDMMLFSYLFLKSKFIPGILASFGILSFALILVLSIMYIVVPQYAAIPINQIIFWFPSGIFEIIIGIWLLSKGLKIQSQI